MSFCLIKKLRRGLTGRGKLCMIQKNQTVEAEITAVTPLQRARGAESWVRNELSNGPLRAQSKAGVPAEYSATCGHTSVAGGMLVLR